jgi:beta-galactosidase
MPAYAAGPATATSWACHRNFGNIEYPQSELRNLITKTENDRVILSADLVFGVQGRKTIVKGKIDYQIDGSGRISVRQRGAFNEALPYFLPRYGYVLSLTDVANEIKYYGYGPAECYEDKISHALLGEHDYLCDDAVGAWEKPQERGSHCHTQWLKLQCGDVTLHITSDDFSFCATRYDVHETATASHKKDLQIMDHTDLYLDHRMSGVGSNSCGGQSPVQACRINGGEAFDFTFEIQPI